MSSGEMESSWQHRLQQGEDLHTEFKERLPQTDDLAAEIVAFANTDGGELLVGVKDDGTPVGVEETDRLARTVDNVCFHNCEPPISVIQETVGIGGKQILVIHIPKGAQRPYRTQRGQYYVRTSSGKRQASREELLRIFQASASLYYDETPFTQTSLADLDETAVEELVERVLSQGIYVTGVPRERLLRNWKLLTTVEEKQCLTLAGVLFTAQSPQQFVPYAYISALRIPGDDIAIAPSDQKQIGGRLHEQVETAFKLLELHLSVAHVIEGIEPERKPEIPVEVLREALVNALAHRDYTVASPVRLIVYNNRVEIRTPGLLPNTVSVEELRYGIHVLRNPAIYSMFLRLGLVTDAGSGIPRMIRLMVQHVGEEPEFAIEGREFVVRLPRPAR